nr:MAG TPA: hypothetical protein [Caudoviricetes sp.]
MTKAKRKRYKKKRTDFLFSVLFAFLFFLKSKF